MRATSVFMSFLLIANQISFAYGAESVETKQALPKTVFPQQGACVAKKGSTEQFWSLYQGSKEENLAQFLQSLCIGDLEILSKDIRKFLNDTKDSLDKAVVVRDEWKFLYFTQSKTFFYSATFGTFIAILVGSEAIKIPRVPRGSLEALAMLIGFTYVLGLGATAAIRVSIRDVEKLEKKLASLTQINDQVDQLLADLKN